MPRVLLLFKTQTYRSAAFLDAAARRNLPVVVGTDRPQTLAALAPHANLTLPFANLEASLAAAKRFAQRWPIDAVVAAEDDTAVLGAHLAAGLGCAGHPPEAVALALDKLRTRERLRDAGLPVPAFRAVPVDADPLEAARAVGFPCVVKPRSMSRSRGVIRADDPTQLAAAWQRCLAIVRSAQPEARELLLESYLEGVEVAVEGLVTAGRLRVLTVFDKPDPLLGPYFEETLYVTPTRLPAAVGTALEAAVQRGVEALGLEHGPVHAEARLDGEHITLLEIAPRSIGGRCAQSLQFQPPFRALEDVLLAHALRQPVDAATLREGASGVWMIPAPRAGMLRAIRGVDTVEATPGIESVAITAAVGTHVAPAPEGDRYVGFVFARAADAAQVEAILRRAQDCLQLEVDSETASPGASSESDRSRRKR